MRPKGRTRPVSSPGYFGDAQATPLNSQEVNHALHIGIASTMYTRAVFREGPYTGNDIPLVSRYTASGGVHPAADSGGNDGRSQAERRL